MLASSINSKAPVCIFLFDCLFMHLFVFIIGSDFSGLEIVMDSVLEAVGQGALIT
jgi:hypothetical protein